MYMIDVRSCECNTVEMEGAKGVQMQWLLDEQSCDAPGFAMRRFILEPGGYTPLHAHPWEHEVFVVRGTGEISHGDRVSSFGPETAILVEADEEHQFRNTGSEPLEFLCLVPNGPATAR